LLHFGQWRTILLGEEEELRWSYDDVKGTFYMFRLPSPWAPLFAIAHRYMGADLSLKEPEVYLASMGWKNAMAIVELVHRKVLLCCLSMKAPVLPLELETCKDRAMPLAAAGWAGESTVWQVYCDDLDIAELVEAWGFVARPRRRPVSFIFWPAHCMPPQAWSRLSRRPVSGLRWPSDWGRVSTEWPARLASLLKEPSCSRVPRVGC
jgi:hypothetical protein